MKLEFDLKDPVLSTPYSDSFIILIKKSKLKLLYRNFIRKIIIENIPEYER